MFKRAVRFSYLWNQGALIPPFFIFMVVVTAAFACFCLIEEILESYCVRYRKHPMAHDRCAFIHERVTVSMCSSEMGDQ